MNGHDNLKLFRRAAHRWAVRSLMRNAAIVVGFGVSLFIAVAGFLALQLYQHGKFDENGARIWTLARLIEATEPSDGAVQTLRRSVTGDHTELPADYWLNDAWGNPFRIRMWRDRNFHYEVISYGSDAQPGPCNVGPDACDQLAADWVIRDGELRE